LTDLERRDIATLGWFIDHYRAILEKCKGYIPHDHHAAEDIAHITFLKAHAHADDYSPELGSPYTWLSRIAYNAFLDYVKRADYRTAKEGEDPGELLLFSDAPPQVQTVEMVTMVDKALDEVTRRQRQIIYLHFWQGYNVAEIARMDRKPESTVRGQLKRAMLKLKRFLIDQGYKKFGDFVA